MCQHIKKIAEIVQALNPLLIYLSPLNVKDALQHVRSERPKEWADFVTWYLMEQVYGKAHGLYGYQGVIQFYGMRQKLELEILKGLPIRSLLVKHDSRQRENCDLEIANFVRANID